MELLNSYPAIVRELDIALPLLKKQLNATQVVELIEVSREIITSGFRSWEAAEEYYKYIPAVLPFFNGDFAEVTTWAKYGVELNKVSVLLAGAYFKNSPIVLRFIRPDQLIHWAELCKVIYKGTWKTSAISCRFFEVSAKILQYHPLTVIESLSTLVNRIGELSVDLGMGCLDAMGKNLPRVKPADIKLYLELTNVLTRSDCNQAKLFFDEGHKIFLIIDGDSKKPFVVLSEEISRVDTSLTSQFILEIPKYLSELTPNYQNYVLKLAKELLPLSPECLISFLKNSPYLSQLLKINELKSWFISGVNILRGNSEAGEAYFQLESTIAEKNLQRLSSSVALSDIKEILQDYCHAISGVNLKIIAYPNKIRPVGPIPVDKTTENSHYTVTLPESVDNYDNKADAFDWYKVTSTHQSGHFEFGSYSLNVGELLEQFNDIVLARDLFVVLEDIRVDSQIKHNYRGIRGAYKHIQGMSLKNRRAITSLPLRQALLELLIQTGLCGEIPAVSSSLRFWSDKASEAVAMLRNPGAVLANTIECLLYLYPVISAVPNTLLSEEMLEQWEDNPDEFFKILYDSALSAPSSVRSDSIYEEVSYASPQLAEFQIPAHIQQHKIKAEADSKIPGQGRANLSPELLKQLMEKIREVKLSRGKVDNSSGLFVTDLDIQSEILKQLNQAEGENLAGDGQGGGGELNITSPMTFLYNEWDYKAVDYRPRWCCVKEKIIGEGDINFYQNTLAVYARLTNEIRYQFEHLSPQLLRKLKRLQDGEELELDAVIEAMVEKKIGLVPSDKIYWRRRKIERDISVAFLLDMSASTTEIVHKDKFEEELFLEPAQYFAVLRSTDFAAQRAGKKYKRIIDLEKESLVLLTHALELIGDNYGIYGFSGYGREGVDFLVIKDLDEKFSETIKRRIDKILPLHATRMGAAIRHTVSKLEKQPHKTKVLFLISDGRPQDQGYGRDGMEKEYAIQDTRMALLEAKRKHIVPFCLTVDKEGHGYLKQMCHDIGYEIVYDIESLPKRLPTLYRSLTS